MNRWADGRASGGSQPYQTIAIDIAAMRDAQKADIRNSVMPKDVTTGQVIWWELTPGSLIGRAEVSNVNQGVASSFSCGTGSCPVGFNGASVSPGSMTAVVGGAGSFLAQETDRDCFGSLFGPYNVNATWSSSNTSVVTVNSSGNASCVGPGTAGLTATWFGTIYNCDPNFNCSTTAVHASPAASVKVVSVKWQKSDGSPLPSPLRVGISATTLGGQTHDRTQRRLRAVVTPVSDASNISIVAVGSGSQPGQVRISNQSADNSTGIVTFDIVGTVKSGNRGDVVLEATEGSTVVKPVAAVSVVVPAAIAGPPTGPAHDTTGGGVVIRNQALDATTSPAILGLPPGQVELATIYVRFLSVKVVDQFGDTIGDTYQGAEVSELAGNTYISINQPLTSSSTYSDPVGEEPFNSIVAAGSSQAKNWPSQPKIPFFNTCISPQAQNIMVRVDGFDLNPAVVDRGFTVCGDGVSTTSPPVTVDISW